MKKNNIKIGALVSGGGTNLQAVIDACKNHEIDGQIVFVGSDNPNAKGLGRAHKYGIPTFVVDYKSIIIDFKKNPDKEKLPPGFDLWEANQKQTLFSLPPSQHKNNQQKHSQQTAAQQKIDFFLQTRAIAEHALLSSMACFSFDLLILAGFMRNLTPYFIDQVNTNSKLPKIMNIHPALLPAFPGIDGYGDTYRYGCKVGGCTVHFIDYGEDSGPIIGQKSFPIEPADTLDHIKEKGLRLEWQLYPECIQLFAENRLCIEHIPLPFESKQSQLRAVVKIIAPSMEGQ